MSHWLRRATLWADSERAQELLDVHELSTAQAPELVRAMDAIGVLGQALRHKLGLRGGQPLGAVMNAAAIPALALAAGFSALALGMEWVGALAWATWERPLFLGFATAGALVLVPAIIGALAVVLERGRLARLMAWCTLTTAALLVTFTAQVPWDRPPLFVIAPVACGALPLALASHPRAMSRPSRFVLPCGLAALAAMGMAMGLAAHAYCAVCVYRGMGPLYRFGQWLPAAIGCVMLAVLLLARMRRLGAVEILATIVTVSPWLIPALATTVHRPYEQTMLAIIIVGAAQVPLAAYALGLRLSLRRVHVE